MRETYSSTWQTLDELDNISNLNQSIWVGLIPQGFSGNNILVVSPVISYDLIVLYDFSRFSKG